MGCECEEESGMLIRFGHCCLWKIHVDLFQMHMDIWAQFSGESLRLKIQI